MIWYDMAWHEIVILDESWFYLSIDHEFIWFPTGAPVFDRERHMIQFLKLMLIIVWNPHGFHLVDVLSKEMKSNRSYYVTRIFELLHEWKIHQVSEAIRKLIVHADDVRFIWQNWSKIHWWLPRWRRLCIHRICRIWYSQTFISSVTLNKL
jgi:hypothetical protein